MYMTETPINTACFDMEMNSVRRFRTMRKFHCTALTCPVVYGIAAIVFAPCLYLQNPVRQSTVRLSTVFIRWERHRGDTASLNLMFWINQNCEIIRLILFNRSEKDIYDTFAHLPTVPFFPGLSRFLFPKNTEKRDCPVFHFSQQKKKKEKKKIIKMIKNKRLRMRLRY